MQENSLRELETIYSHYLDTVARIRASAPALDGVLGLGGVLRSNPCHEDFARAVEQLMQAAAEEGDAAAAEALIRRMVTLARENSDDRSVGVMLQAVQQYARLLVPLLPPERAAALAGWYSGLYPRSQCLPAQRQLLQDLQRRSGKAPGGLARFFRR